MLRLVDGLPLCISLSLFVFLCVCLCIDVPNTDIHIYMYICIYIYIYMYVYILGCTNKNDGVAMMNKGCAHPAGGNEEHHPRLV